MELAIRIGVPVAALLLLIRRTLVVLLPLVCATLVLTLPVQVPDLLTDRTTAHAFPLVFCLLYAMGQTWFWTRHLILWQFGYRANYLAYDSQTRSFSTLCNYSIEATGTYVRPIVLQLGEGRKLVLFSIGTLTRLAVFYALIIPLAFSQMLYQNTRHDALDFVYLLLLSAGALYVAYLGYLLLSTWYWDRRDVDDDAGQRVKLALTPPRPPLSVISLFRFLFLRWSSPLAMSLVAIPICLVWYSAHAPGELAKAAGTEGILFLALGSMAAMGALVSLVFATIRMPPVTTLLLWLILVSLYAPTRHEIPERGSLQVPLTAKATIPTELCHWLAANGDATSCATPGSSPGKDLPIIFVSASGGGLRAAYWTGSILGALSDCVPGFDSAVFSVSAVSGGSLGAAVYELGVKLARSRDRECQLFHGATAGTPSSPRYSVRQMVADALTDDFLAPLAERLLFGDLFSTFFPMHKFWSESLADRGDALRNSWEASFRSACERSGAPCAQADTLGAFLLDRSGQQDWTPVTVFNSTHLETGVRLLNSTASFRSFGLDFHEVAQADITIGDAVLNSARFPLISPAGRITNHRPYSLPTVRGHAIDGAYADNSGLQTTYEIAREVIAAATTLNVTLRPIFLNIENDPAFWAAMRMSQNVATAFFKGGRGEITQAEAMEVLLKDRILQPSRAVGESSESRFGLALDGAGIWHELLVAVRGAMNVWESSYHVAAQQKLDQFADSVREVNVRLCPDGEHNPTLGWKLGPESRAVIEKVMLETPKVRASPDAIAILFDVESKAITDEQYQELFSQGPEGRQEARERMERYEAALREYRKIDASTYEALFGKRRYGRGFGNIDMLGEVLMLNLCHNAIHDSVRSIREAIGGTRSNTSVGGAGHKIE